jgi:hypothetical protein
MLLAQNSPVLKLDQRQSLFPVQSVKCLTCFCSLFFSMNILG